MRCARPSAAKNLSLGGVSVDDILRRGYLDEKQRDGLVADQLAILGFTALLGGLLLSYAQRRRTRV
jgi:hypothetical protein